MTTHGIITIIVDSNNSPSPILFFNRMRLRIELLSTFSSLAVTLEANINGIMDNKNSNGAITTGSAILNAKQDSHFSPVHDLLHRKK